MSKTRATLLKNTKARDNQLLHQGRLWMRDMQLSFETGGLPVCAEVLSAGSQGAKQNTGILRRVQSRLLI